MVGILNALIGSYAPVGGSYESIQTVTVGSGGAATVSFTSIPSTYKHLQIRAMARENTGGSSGFQSCFIYLNSDTGNNYSTHRLFGTGSSVSADGGGNQKMFISGMPSGSNYASTFGVSIIDILDYTNTNKNTTTRSLTGGDANDSFGIVSLGSGSWLNTNAVTTITLESTNIRAFAQHSSFALYGIKG